MPSWKSNRVASYNITFSRTVTKCTRFQPGLAGGWCSETRRSRSCPYMVNDECMGSGIRGASPSRTTLSENLNRALCTTNVCTQSSLHMIGRQSLRLFQSWLCSGVLCIYLYKSALGSNVHGEGWGKLLQSPGMKVCIRFSYIATRSQERCDKPNTLNLSSVGSGSACMRRHPRVICMAFLILWLE